MLEITGLQKSYGECAVLRGVDLHAPPGRVLGLLGANGAGKTTLISIVAGLRRADGGDVRVAGVNALREPRRAARHLGLAPQGLGLYPTLTVEANLTLFARLAGLRGPAVGRRVRETAERLGLAELLGRRSAELSGGQQRRLHTGMAVLHRPDVMFLDEPTVGADVQSRAGILDVVRSLADEGATVVYTTHYLPEIERLGADVAILHEGRIAVRGGLDEVIGRYACASVALRFAGPPPALRGWRAEGTSLRPARDVLDPGAEAARALAALGDAAGDLIGVEITPAGLETAYLAITGDRPEPEDSHALVA
jgi:ABC-2 type transport system ATP-binding protein